MSVWLTGIGTAKGGDDPTPWLGDPKEAKYLGLQDKLAVVAAGRSAVGQIFDPETTGLSLAVGHLPFDPADISRVLDASIDEQGAFSLHRFTEAGWSRARPLLAFKCLPNMVAYHVASSLRIAGPCQVGYPGPSQLYEMLRDAVEALLSGRLSAAVVGGVAAQRNWLVEHHYARLLPPIAADRLCDAAGVLVLRADPAGRALARLVDLGADYVPFDPREGTPPLRESPGDGLLRGPASMPCALAEHIERGSPWPFRHEMSGIDGTTCFSVWEAP